MSKLSLFLKDIENHLPEMFHTVYTLENLIISVKQRENPKKENMCIII